MPLRPRQPERVPQQDDLHRARHEARPPRVPARALRDAVLAQRSGARARQLPRARRLHRGVSRVRAVRDPHRPLRRRDRDDPALRPDERRAARRRAEDLHLPRRPLCDARRAEAGRDRVDPRRARRARRRAARRRQAARGAAPPRAHEARPRVARGNRLLQRHRELLAAFRRASVGRARVDAPRLLPPGARRKRRGRLARHHRRVPCHAAADPRHVLRRPRAQADARRPRIPPSERARQPTAQVRGVRRARAAGDPCQRDARTVGARPGAGRRRRAGDPPDGPRRPADRGPPRAHAGARPPQGSAPPRREGRAHARHGAHEAALRGPHRVPPQGGNARPLPPQRDRDARAARIAARPARRRVRCARGRQPAARRP